MSEAISSSTTRSASRAAYGSHLGFELSGGYAIDRFYFEGGGYSNHNENRIDIPRRTVRRRSDHAEILTARRS